MKSDLWRYQHLLEGTWSAVDDPRAEMRAIKKLQDAKLYLEEQPIKNQNRKVYDHRSVHDSMVLRS
jgi:hypothetical protein